MDARGFENSDGYTPLPASGIPPAVVAVGDNQDEDCISDVFEAEAEGTALWHRWGEKAR
jgi:hypothetical protein